MLTPRNDIVRAHEQGAATETMTFPPLSSPSLIASEPFLRASVWHAEAISDSAIRPTRRGEDVSERMRLRLEATAVRAVGVYSLRQLQLLQRVR